MPGRSFSAGNQYRYGFNGKENDRDIDGNSYDYGFRIYNPQLGRFLSVDPIASGYPWNSTYAFAENRVIDGVDQDGGEFKHFLNWMADKIEGKHPIISGIIRAVAPFTGVNGIDYIWDKVDAAKHAIAFVKMDNHQRVQDIKNTVINNIPVVRGVSKIAKGGKANVAQGATETIIDIALIAKGGGSGSLETGAKSLEATAETSSLSIHSGVGNSDGAMMATENTAAGNPSQKGANANDNVTYYRVQGGTPPAASKNLISFDNSGITKFKNATLNVSTGNLDHAEHFLALRPGANIINSSC